jgi:NADH dehydrogenase
MLNVPKTKQHRVVIVGGGFGGLLAARKLAKKNVQVILIDKNNFHQFQPLFYQVAMSGLEPANILFPLRKIFQKSKNIHIRCTTALQVIPNQNILETEAGSLHYDTLLLAMGAGNYFFNNQNFEQNTITMKSVSESLYLRNKVLEMLENYVNEEHSKNGIDICIVGGGPTGVELSGALAEMRKHAFPRDYPGINFNKMRIVLLEGSDRVLGSFHAKSAERVLNYLKKLGVQVILNERIKKYENYTLELESGEKIPFAMVIWAAGIRANGIAGLPPEAVNKSGRIITDAYLKVLGTENVFCIGDQSLLRDEANPEGYPQMAQPAMQQGKIFAKNVLNKLNNKPAEIFKYKDLGSMATVGRNLAVAEIKGFYLGGFFAWIIWMAVHLMSIVGVKNRLFIFINWLWSYFTYDQSLRLLIKPLRKSTKP